MRRIDKPITTSRYIKPDHLETGDAWTEDGKEYRKLYDLLSKLKVINAYKLLADYYE